MSTGITNTPFGQSLVRGLNELSIHASQSAATISQANLNVEDFVKHSLITVLVVQLAISVGSLHAEETGAKLSYDRDIRPILADKCFACHGFDEHTREADLRLDTRQGALDSGSGGAVVPGDIAASKLIERMNSHDEDLVMPPPSSGRRLTDQQKQMLQRWIEEGADYQQHWAFQAPQPAEPPRTSPQQNPIDAFVRDRLRKEGIEPSPSATPEVLLRRLSLDLTGLPPTIEQLDQFVAEFREDSSAAYTRAIDRLLESPHYGERFGRWWLDQARYADSNGYSVDAPRQIWLYRDWVVQSLNENMPFNQFTIEQLAGDLLPDSTQSQKIATGFHRNTQINQEGGIDPEQFRIESVFDRVATTGTVWLGLTIGCAQCHNHKFDPISQREYFELFAFLNNQDEPELKLEKTDPEVKAISTLVLRERAEPRKTHVFIKGDFTRPAEQVWPGTPSVLHPLEENELKKSSADQSSSREDQPKPSPQEGQAEATTEIIQTNVPKNNRLDLARWIVERNNPLTARVIVNRIWLHYFGRGLVETENDFGLQGTPPSHPELLDWLAVEFMESGWDLKRLHKLMVTSTTYQQSSKCSPEQMEKDPYNTWLGRQQRLRLEAEIVRDVALQACGQLAPRLGGPPVYPPIPEGVMNQGQVKRDWKTSTGEDRYRRGLYTFVFRATPPPSLNVFDAPDGFSTCTRRIRSNTPLQALTLMNDAAYFEFAEFLEKIIQQDGLITAFRRCTSRTPTPAELTILQRLDSLNAARAILNLDETISRE
jgi:Protein of unknown function (DUF1553)/Protein of unknown function (DUF1549)/Planctomycete cytochrome C